MVLGVLVGSVLGWLCFVTLRGCFRYALSRLSRIVNAQAVSVLIAMTVALIPASAILLLTLVLQYVVAVWDRFLIGWTFGLLIGMYLSNIGRTGRRQVY